MSFAQCGIGNVECGMKGILPCKIRLYSIDGIDSERFRLSCAVASLTFYIEISSPLIIWRQADCGAHDCPLNAARFTRLTWFTVSCRTGPTRHMIKEELSNVYIII